MTPTEVLNEIDKMAPVEKRKLLEKLSQEIKKNEKSDSELLEESFLENLRQKGLLSQIPKQRADEAIRQDFNRVEIKGEPLSETIIKERG